MTLIVSGKLLVFALHRGIASVMLLSVGTNRLHALLRMRTALSTEKLDGGVVLVRTFASGGLHLVIAIDSQAST